MARHIDRPDRPIVVANATNGLALPPWDRVSMFLSTHAHHMKDGYFNDYAMPWDVVIHLLKGGKIIFKDATSHNRPLSDAARAGLPTWMLVFNHAIGEHVKVCDWQTPEMVRAARTHDKLKRRIRRLIEVFGHRGPIRIGEDVTLVIKSNFRLDDKPKEIGEHYYEVCRANQNSLRE